MNSPAGRECSAAVPIPAIPELVVTPSTSPLKMWGMLPAYKVIVGNSVTTSMQRILIPIIPISISKSERDVRPSATGVNLHPPSCFVSHHYCDLILDNFTYQLITRMRSNSLSLRYYAIIFHVMQAVQPKSIAIMVDVPTTLPTISIVAVE